MYSILDTVGKTPLIQLQNIVATEDADLFLKLERTNPGGSIKDRPALG
jgi:cystathionine beta-synthase/cysteine synthase A